MSVLGQGKQDSKKSHLLKKQNANLLVEGSFEKIER